MHPSIQVHALICTHVSYTCSYLYKRSYKRRHAHTYVGDLGASLYGDSTRLVDHNAFCVLEEHSLTDSLDIAVGQPQRTRTGICGSVAGGGEKLAVHMNKLARLEAPCGVSLPRPRTIAILNLHFARADELLHKRERQRCALLREKPV
jgi:hypothetical protein